MMYRSKKSRKTCTTLIIGFVLLFMKAASFCAEVYDPKNILVDDNKRECPKAQFSSIQAAIDAAPEKARIKVCPGIYDEQIIIEKPVRIDGEYGAIIMPDMMEARGVHLTSSVKIAASVEVRNTVDVIINRLTIDGFNNGITINPKTCEPFLMGIVYQNASGTIQNTTIRNHSPRNPEVMCKRGFGVFVQSNEHGKAKVEIKENTIHNYQKGGIVAEGPRTNVKIIGNTITGFSPSPVAESHNIQVDFGAKGLIKSNIIAGTEHF